MAYALKTFRTLTLIIASGFLLVMGASVQIVDAVALTEERLILGTSAPSETTSHSYSFLSKTASNLGYIEFEYCSNNPFNGAPCTVPVGIDLSGAVLDSQSGTTDFEIDPVSTNGNRIAIKRSPVLAIAANTNVEYIFSQVINPATPNKSFFVRINTHVGEDNSSQLSDTGALVFSTSGQVSVGGYVPPYLTFCVGVTVEPRCESSTNGIISLGELSPNSTVSATSQYAVATNIPDGYNVYVTGSTMTSGNQTIEALSTPTNSRQGENQFGFNLRENTGIATSSDVTGDGTGFPVSSKNFPGLFSYVPGELISSSNLPTNFNRFTTTYIINIREDQKPGIYSTTLQYIATANF